MRHWGTNAGGCDSERFSGERLARAASVAIVRCRFGTGSLWRPPPDRADRPDGPTVGAVGQRGRILGQDGCLAKTGIAS